MILLLLAAAALVLAYLSNRLLLRFLHENAVIYGAPILEELIKTLPAYLLNRPVFYVHFVFGIGEAAYDMITGSSHTGRTAAALSILSHAFFGGAAAIIIEMTRSIIAALVVSIGCHLAWNYAIIRSGRSKK